MELIAESDSYLPCIDDFGNYIDKIPSCNILKRGILCPCGSRKDKLYDSYGVFSGHIKTKTHQKWLVNLNLNKANFYIETESLKKTLQSQRMIIAKLDNELQKKNMTIDYLTQQLVKINDLNKVDLINDLLSFD